MRRLTVIDQAFEKFPVRCPKRQADTFSSFHLYIVILNDTVRIGRNQIYQWMREQGIGVIIHYMPVHLQPYYQKLGFARGDFPIAEDYHSRTITYHSATIPGDDTHRTAQGD